MIGFGMFLVTIDTVSDLSTYHDVCCAEEFKTSLDKNQMDEEIKGVFGKGANIRRGNVCHK